jgi:hypothetical protein
VTNYTNGITLKFAGIPLLNRADLLDELKGLLSLEEDMTMMKATGIPPHVKQAETLKEILKLTQDTLKLIMNQTEDIKNTVREAIQANDVQPVGAFDTPCPIGEARRTAAFACEDSRK